MVPPESHAESEGSAACGRLQGLDGRRQHECVSHIVQSVRACNSKTIAPINLICLNNKENTCGFVLLKVDPNRDPDLDSRIYYIILHHCEITEDQRWHQSIFMPLHQMCVMMKKMCHDMTSSVLHSERRSAISDFLCFSKSNYFYHWL